MESMISWMLLNNLGGLGRPRRGFSGVTCLCQGPSVQAVLVGNLPEPRFVPGPGGIEKQYEESNSNDLNFSCLILFLVI